MTTACPPSGHQQVTDTPMDYRIRIVVRIIEEQKGEIHLTVKESSGLLGVTEAHLLRLFKREVGMTFRRYLRKRRMVQAAELLSDSSLAIKGIALVSGYSDVSNFYRDFKQVHGMTPQKLRAGQFHTAVQGMGDPKTPRGTLLVSRQKIGLFIHQQGPLNGNAS